MNTHETYVSLETAKLLKEEEFDWECNAHYKQNGDFIFRGYDHDWNAAASVKPNVEYYSAPTLSVAQRWLREVKGIEITIDWCIVVDGKIVDFNERCYSYHVESGHFADGSMFKFKTYEEALEAGIQKCLELKTKITFSNPHCEHDE